MKPPKPPAGYEAVLETQLEAYAYQKGAGAEKAKSQTETALQLLRDAGSRGLTRSELHVRMVAVHGPQCLITAVQRIVVNLLASGHIRHKVNRDGDLLTRRGAIGRDKSIVVLVDGADLWKTDVRFEDLAALLQEAISDRERVAREVVIARGREREVMSRVHARIKHLQMLGQY